MDHEPSQSDSGSFSAAQELQRLAKPELDTPPAEFEPRPDMIVEQRRLGRVQLTGVLGTHTPEHMATITQAMSHGDVLAFEQAGAQNEASRHQYEDFYTRLLSSDLAPDKADAAFAKLSAEAAGQDSAWLLDVLAQFKGTDKRIVLLDIAQDHPDFPRVQESVELRRQLAEDIAGLSPLAHTRENLAASIAATAESYRIRDHVLASQLQQLGQSLDQPDQAPTVTALVGMMHHRAITETGTPADPTVSAANQVQLTHTLSPYDQAVEVTRQDGAASPATIDRVLLSLYLHTPTLSPLNAAEASDVVGSLDDTQIGGILSNLEHYIAEPAEHPGAKEKQIGTFLKAVVELTTE